MTSLTAKVLLKKHSKYADNRLSKREFRHFVQYVVDEIPGADTFEYFVEFLVNSVEVGYTAVIDVLFSHYMPTFMFVEIYCNVKSNVVKVITWRMRERLSRRKSPVMMNQTMERSNLKAHVCCFSVQRFLFCFMDKKLKEDIQIKN